MSEPPDGNGEEKNDASAPSIAGYGTPFKSGPAPMSHWNWEITQEKEWHCFSTISQARGATSRVKCSNRSSGSWDFSICRRRTSTANFLAPFLGKKCFRMSSSQTRSSSLSSLRRTSSSWNPSPSAGGVALLTLLELLAKRSFYKTR